VPALIADVSCFGGLFSCPEASSMLYHNFCIYHVDAPGCNRQLLKGAWQWLRNECIIVLSLGTWKLLLQHERQCLHLERVGQKMDMCKENWSPIRLRCQILHICVEALEASAQVALTCQWCGMLAGWCPWNPTRSRFVVCGRPGRPSGWSFRFLWVSGRIQSLFLNTPCEFWHCCFGLLR
jgi:hypothetical protein